MGRARLFVQMKLRGRALARDNTKRSFVVFWLAYDVKVDFFMCFVPPPIPGVLVIRTTSFRDCLPIITPVPFKHQNAFMKSTALKKICSLILLTSGMFFKSA